jgi:hypothetical protein
MKHKIKQLGLKYYGVDPTEKSRKVAILIHRQSIAYILKTELKMSYEAISFLFELDHATMIHSVKVVKNELKRTHNEHINRLKNLAFWMSKLDELQTSEEDYYILCSKINIYVTLENGFTKEEIEMWRGMMV